MTTNHIKALSIQIYLGGLSFCILNRSTNTIENLYHLSFEKKLTPYTLLNRLRAEISTNTIFSDHFDSVMIIYQNELSTLVPKALYTESNNADYLKFNSKILKTDFISHDELDINKSINVYVPYVNINNYIFDTFGEFFYKHSSTIFIETILKNTDENESSIHLNVSDTTIAFTAIKNGQLQLYNAFEYTTPEDFIYYVLFTMEQLQLDTETTPVKISGVISTDQDLYSMLYKYVRHVEFKSFDLNYEIDPDIDNKKIHYSYIILNSF